MARPRKTLDLNAAPAGLMSWADALGEALGRGVARGMNQGLSSMSLGNGAFAASGPRKRGRPPKPVVGYVPPDRRCSVAGCGRAARAKGLCSAHYQAARRKKLLKA
jgi:hypothetical protein